MRNIAYDADNPLSNVLPSALAVVDALTVSPGFRKLFDNPLSTADVSDPIRNNIYLGEGKIPDEGLFSNPDDVKELLATALVTGGDDNMEIAYPQDSVSCPDESYAITVQIRTHIREAELDEIGEDGAYNGFWDIATSLPSSIVNWIDKNSDIDNCEGASIIPFVYWPELEQQAAQGKYLETFFDVRFGREI